MDVAPPPRPRLPFAGLALLLAAALGLRLLPVLAHGDHPALFMDSDSWGYHRLASNLLAGNGYTWDMEPPRAPNLYRPPGFPVLLWGLYRLTGPSVPAAIVSQALVGTAAVLLTFLLARGLGFAPKVALGAAAVQALDPVAVQYCNILLTETYTSVVVLLVAGCLGRYRSAARPGWLAAAGGLLGLGILVHPVLLFLPLLLPAVPLLARATRTRRQFAAALGASALALAPASAWIVRNWYVGDFVGISSVTAVNLLKYKAAGVEAELRGTSREAERDRLTRECDAELPPGATPGERYRLWQRRGTSILLAHPLTYAKVHARGMAVELIGPERDHTTRLLYGPATLDAGGRYGDASIAAARTERPAPALEAARFLVLGWQGLLLLGLAAGAWQMVRRRPLLLAALLVVPAYVLALSGGPEGSPRFRVIYLPVLSLMTAVGMQAVVSWISRLRAARGTAGAGPRLEPTAPASAA
jgi:4-amino-4-deoxy-L-arabinose transferase-like glycosyltransferase